MVQAIVWLVVGVTFFLSLWIVLPGPNLFFLRLAVGAPEISPFLLIVAILTTALTLWLYPKPPVVILSILLITTLLSTLPLLQQPQAVNKAQASLAQAFTSFNQESPRSQVASSAWSWIYFFCGMPQEKIRYQANIPFASSAGADLSLDLYQPLQPGHYPAVITIYGGGWSAGSPSENAKFSRYLSAKGYVVIGIDYRHAPQFQFPAQLEDIQTALAFIRDRTQAYEIDPNRISLVGWSAGAHLAMLAGFQLKQNWSNEETSTINIRSIVDYYGPVNLSRGYAEPPIPDPLDVRQVLLDFIGGPPSEFPEVYNQASPITYVNAAQPNALPPTLLIYGGRDHVVEARFGKSLYDAITDSGNQAVWVTIPWAEHAFDKVFNGVSNQLALHFVEQFLEKTLYP